MPQDPDTSLHPAGPAAPPPGRMDRHRPLGWRCLETTAIGGPSEWPLHVNAVLLHPVHGIALIDVAPCATPRPIETMRQMLAEKGLHAWPAAEIPILYLCVTTDELGKLPQLLRAAVARRPEPAVHPGRRWMAEAEAALAMLDHRPAAPAGRIGGRGLLLSGLAASSLCAVLLGAGLLAPRPLTMLAPGGAAGPAPARDGGRMDLAGIEALWSEPGPARIVLPAPVPLSQAVPAPPPLAGPAMAVAPLPAPDPQPWPAAQASGNLPATMPAPPVLALPPPGPAWKDASVPPLPAVTAPAVPAAPAPGAAAGMPVPPVLPRMASVPPGPAAPERPAAMQAPSPDAMVALAAAPPAGFAVPLPPPPPVRPWTAMPEVGGDGPVPPSERMDAPASGPRARPAATGEPSQAPGLPRLVALAPARPEAAGPAAGRRPTTLPAATSSRAPASPRCGLLLARLQLGERPSDADRALLRSACAPAP